jgi:hypothetical protein
MTTSKLNQATKKEEMIICVDQGVSVTDGVEVILQPVIEEGADKSLFGYRVVKAPAPVWAFIFGKEVVSTDPSVISEIAGKGWRIVIESASVSLNMKLKDGALSLI